MGDRSVAADERGKGVLVALLGSLGQNRFIFGPRSFCGSSARHATRCIRLRMMPDIAIAVPAAATNHRTLDTEPPESERAVTSPPVTDTTEFASRTAVAVGSNSIGVSTVVVKLGLSASRSKPTAAKASPISESSGNHASRIGSSMKTCPEGMWATGPPSANG